MSGGIDFREQRRKIKDAHYRGFIQGIYFLGGIFTILVLIRLIWGGS
jgi:hypothetical protein